MTTSFPTQQRSLSLPACVSCSFVRISSHLSARRAFFPLLPPPLSALPSSGRTGPSGIFDEISGKLRQWRLVLLFDSVKDWQIVKDHIDRTHAKRRALYFGVFALMTRDALAGEADELPRLSLATDAQGSELGGGGGEGRGAPPVVDASAPRAPTSQDVAEADAAATEAAARSAAAAVAAAAAQAEAEAKAVAEAEAEAAAVAKAEADAAAAAAAVDAAAAAKTEAAAEAEAAAAAEAEARVAKAAAEAEAAAELRDEGADAESREEGKRTTPDAAAAEKALAHAEIL